MKIPNYRNLLSLFEWVPFQPKDLNSRFWAVSYLDKWRMAQEKKMTSMNPHLFIRSYEWIEKPFEQADLPESAKDVQVLGLKILIGDEKCTEDQGNEFCDYMDFVDRA